jgi:hypothetical protein
MKKILLFALLVVAFGAQAQNKVQKAAPKKAPQKVTPHFAPSKFPGVVVRSVPLKNPQSGASFVYIKPGGTRPTRVLRLQSRQAIKTGRGDSPKGGNYVTLPEHRLPMSVARKEKNGKITAE